MTETEYRERCATIEAEYDAAIRKARRQADRLALYVERQKRLDNLTWRFQRSQLTEA